MVDKRSKLTPKQFIDEYESLNKPLILTDAMDSWKAKKKWTVEGFSKHYGDKLLKSNATGSDGHCFKMTFNEYMKYCKDNHDEKPIYLFDNKFVERIPQLLEDYEVPVYFKDDLFDYMKPEDRPDYKWFLSGPPRSGSPFHQGLRFFKTNNEKGFD